MYGLNAREFIEAQIPRHLQDMLPSALKAAYDAVNKLVSQVPFLQVESAIFGHGHLIAWAADYQIFRLIRDGLWPFDCEWCHFARPTGMYLRVDTGGALVTISQIPDIEEAPRHAVFRANAKLSNYPLLPFDEFQKEMEDEERPHLIVGHGYQRFNFATIAAPHPKRPTWIDRTENLLLRKKPEAAGVPVYGGPPEEEGSDISIDLELQEYLEKQIRDSNG